MGEDVGTNNVLVHYPTRYRKTKFVKYGVVYVISKTKEIYHCHGENGAGILKYQYQYQRSDAQDAKKAFRRVLADFRQPTINTLHSVMSFYVEHHERGH